MALMLYAALQSPRERKPSVADFIGKDELFFYGLVFEDHTP